MRIAAAGLVLLVASVHQTVAAQDYSGRYLVSGGQGGDVTLTLLQDARGNVTGTMSGSGVAYQVEGMLEGGNAVGAIYNEDGGVYFEATLTGAQLTLVLIEPDANNQPDYSRTRQLVLARQGGGGAGTPSPRLGNPPSPSGIASGGGGGAGAAGLIGNWSCQTPEGPGQLVFHSANELSYNGERSPYQLLPGVVRAPGEWGPVDYRYQLAGDRLTISNPDGSTTQCSRQAQGQAAPGGGLGAPSGSQGAGGGLERLLQGRICAYSSSPDGGYSTTRTLIFDGRGRFTYGTLGEVDVPEVVGYGQSGGSPGSYRVTGANRGDEVHLQFDGGDRVVVYVHHLYQGQIVELQYQDQVYGASLCP